MKTVRFQNVVAKCGRPEIHLTLVEPSKDLILQTAVKAQRVMTVFQDTVGTKSDREKVGFESGSLRQFLIFPKSLRSLAGKTVVGIKYDLLKVENVSKKDHAPALPARTKTKAKRRDKKETPSPSRAAHKNVVAFKREEPADEENKEVSALKKQVRHAMEVLETGKPVAAFNMLKRLVDG